MLLVGLYHETIARGRRNRPEDRSRCSFQDFRMTEKEGVFFELIVLQGSVETPSVIIRQTCASTVYLINFSQLQTLSPVHVVQGQLCAPQCAWRGIAVGVLLEAEHAS